MILSRHPIVDADFFRFSLNGNVYQIWYGDGLAGAGVGMARVLIQVHISILDKQGDPGGSTLYFPLPSHLSQTKWGRHKNNQINQQNISIQSARPLFKCMKYITG